MFIVATKTFNHSFNIVFTFISTQFSTEKK